MQRLQAFKYELRPDSQQQRQMRRYAGSCRFVFNKALALQKARDEQADVAARMGVSQPVLARIEFCAGSGDRPQTE